ncbi:DEAD/DEAH box helicase [Halalkalibacter akibai]|uniref:Helicase n=1 Tax=Halalkalibacter akibai (strain ATCC 43226 / DSM 21942 / CIP 109018 / JCM 9157 / 1139) TaxID=1236973 RepID=W4QTD5_HALA3|nr:DEAD/DEAH box helicase [Halalkalibacter akibai]GAE35400.1 helicase [Halalkalibacter akibai JCM 9157]
MTSNIIVHAGWLDEAFFIWAERPPTSRFDQIVNFQYPFLYPPFELKLTLFKKDQISFYGTFIDSDKAILDVPIQSRIYKSLAGEITVYQAQANMEQYSFPIEGLCFQIDTLVQYLPLFKSWQQESDITLAPDFQKWISFIEHIQQHIVDGAFSPNGSGEWQLEQFPYDHWLEAIPLSGRSIRANTSYIQQQTSSVVTIEQLQEITLKLTDGLIRSLMQEPVVYNSFTDWKHSVRSEWLPVIEKLNEKGKYASEISTPRFQQQVGVVQTKPFMSGLALREPASKDGAWEVSLCMVDRKRPSLMIEMEQLEKGEHPWRENPIAQLKIDLKKAQTKIELLKPLRLSASTLSLTAEEAYYLFTSADELLKQIGFHLIVPKWMTEKKKPRVKLVMDQPDRSGSKSEPLLDWQSVASFTYDIALGDQKISKKEFQEFVEGQRPFLYANGQWTSWDPTLADKLLQYLEGAQDHTSYLEAFRLDQMNEDLDDDLGDLDIEWDVSWGKELTESLKELYNSTPTLISVPDELTGTLRPYQLEGVSWLAHLRRTGFGGCLADDMGLGKSIQTIAYMLYVIHSQKEKTEKHQPFLLICPTSLLYNWVAECEQFAPSIRVFVHHGTARLSEEELNSGQWDIVITTYQLSVRDSSFFQEKTWNGLILDEAQHIKNIETKQRRVIKGIKATHRVALTGTPIENRLRELWSLLDVLNPSYLGSYQDFQKSFMKPIERDQDEEQLRKLQTLIHPLILRRKKSDQSLKLGLPKKEEIIHHVHLSLEQAGLYQAVVDDIVTQLAQVSALERRALILKSLTKLKQICNHPAHFLKDRTLNDHTSGKWDAFLNLATELFSKKEKVLIFSQYKEMGFLMTQALERHFQQTVPFLHGSLTRIKRQEAIKAFQEQSDIQFFVLSLKAGGVGLNLTSATNVVHYDRWWNPAVENQATDRAYRIGQTKDVTVHKLVTTGTLEERIDRMLVKKQALADNILAAGEQRITELTNEEIFELIQLTL